MKEIYISADTCKNTTDQMRDKLCSSDVDTEHQCTLLVTADCIERTTELGPTKQTEQQNDKQYCYNNTDFNIRININAFLVNRTHTRNDHTCHFQLCKCLILYVERVGMNNRCHTTCKEHTCQ